MTKETTTILEYLKRIEAKLLNQKAILTLDECSDYTSLSKSFLYRLSSTGRIPCYKPRGKCLVFDKAEIDQWLLQNRKATAEELEIAANTEIILNSNHK